ncbi:response regulator [Metabacillus idriensis]|uniref:response regulator n=1 Tax=Metabacillus idriensis TaxID=324768 RepID=UPI0014789472|nr:response regulator [Metabacillus idriensis]
MLYKLLIADDESNIRRGIQAMIEREFSGEIETLLAGEGLEASERLNNEKIDILVTDIKMPRMNGVELIQSLQEKDQIPVLIILSGYDDFEYTKAAIKCRVKDYLLKPVNRHELFQTIRSTLDDFKKTETITQRELEEVQSSQLQYILLNPLITEEQIKEICGKIQLDLSSESYYTGVIDSKNGIENVKKHLEKSGMKSYCFLDQKERAVILSEDKNIFPFLKEQLGSVSIGFSEGKTGFRHLKASYLEAAEAVKYGFLYPRNQLIDYNDIQFREENVLPPIEEIKKIKNMLGTVREQEIKSLLLKILDYEKITTYSISYLEEVNREMNRLIFDSFFARFGEESAETFKLISKTGCLYSFRDFYHYLHETQNLLMRLHEYMKQTKSISSEQNHLEQAMQFIQENYYKDLNLAVVSNHISLNYSYFSHVFKESTGQNFVDYLKQIRILNSKKWLRESDLKVFEISEKVGYKNPKQFARVFREIEGISPKEFREQVREAGSGMENSK